MNAHENIEMSPVDLFGFHVREFQSYEEIKPFWHELNQNYKDGELSLDYETHKLIWERFYRPRGAGLKIVVGFDQRKCVGIFPFIWNAGDPCDPLGWYLGDDFIIAREYFCAPETINRLVDYLPPHYGDDLSCFYTPAQPHSFSCAPGGIVDLKGSEEEYLRSLKKKSRHTLKRTAVVNADIVVEVDSKIRWEEIQGIYSSQLDYWEKKNGSISEAYSRYSRDKILTDFLVMTRAQEMGKLIALYFYLGGQIVAANFSVRREENRVDDYICLRNCQEEYAWRGLGIYAILKNMGVCRQLGIQFYDLSSCLRDYKKKFINTQSFYYSLSNPCGQIPEESEEELSGIDAKNNREMPRVNGRV